MYLFALDGLLLLGMLLAARAGFFLWRGALTSREALGRIGIAMLPAGISGAPLLLDILRHLPRDGQGVRLDDAPTYMWFTLAGGLVGLVVFGMRVLQQRSTSANFLSIGGDVLGLLLGLYLTFVGADQALFFGTRQDVGMVNWAYFQQTGDVKDVECDAEMMVLRDTDSDQLTYRCPRSVMFGAYSVSQKGPTRVEVELHSTSCADQR